MAEVSKTDFKARAHHWLREVERTGEPLIVTDHGRPCVEIRRYEAESALPADLTNSILRGTVTQFDGFPKTPNEEDND